MAFKRAKLVLIFLQQYILLVFCHGYQHSLLTDKAALLAFKMAIVSDPNSVLTNWDEASDVCNFTGVICHWRHHHRVVRLILNGTLIGGQLSSSIANLTGLRYIFLSDNHLYGVIPPELSSLRHLQKLRLDGNNLHGSIPESLSFLSKLISLRLRRNNLTGTIPPSIFSNCTSLIYVDLSENKLTGQIPPEIGIPTGIWHINLFTNSLSGKIPETLSNLSGLLQFDVESNFLSGELPTEIIEKLGGLVYLHLSYNHMVSHDNNTNLEPFFTSLTKNPELEGLELAGMGLGGRLSDTIGQLGAGLSHLELQENRIFGPIPSNIANLKNLTLLNLSSNLLNGTIPAEIDGRFNMLQELMLSNNSLTGPIPATLGHITSLGLVDLSNNSLIGEIPPSLGNLSELTYLYLNNNLLSGAIPPEIGHCKDLYRLDLSYNRLKGRIPGQILSGLNEIRMFLNLSHNFLEGNLPLEISKMESVQEIDLSANNLSGNIFPQLSNCLAVTLINLSYNSFEGQLPESLGDLRNLGILDVSNNHLSGGIPASLSKCPSLKLMNLSFNDFNGSIPNTGGIFNLVTNLSFLGNIHLCGSVPGFRVCHTKKHYWVHSRKNLILVCVIGSVFAFLATVVCVIGLRRIKGMLSSRKEEAFGDSTPALRSKFPRITHRELSEATRGFDEERLIGSGSYGHVYKGVLGDGTLVAVKVLKLQTGNSTKSFNRECQVLKRIRHRNLMRIITACSLPDFKALVLPYMANGSLESHLYPSHQDQGTGLRSGSSDLSLIQRVNICSDIAEGMAYLHHHSPIKVIHCDLKPSNVLLNDEMTALVSDFGIARLVMNVEAGNNGGVENMGNSTANMLAGSIGYIAPEYGYGAKTSTKGDVYSFGILVLEMVTRKRPTDDMFASGLSLHKWVKNHFHGRVEKVIDSSLMRAERDQSPEVQKMWEVAISELIELGLLCTQEAQSTRPSMLDAADDLNRLKRYLDGDTTATFASSLGISSSTIDDQD
ncbi:putative leucine-rich repeat receptor-like serine/threonine-protein kinase At2g24130 [Telopea speciosissima]|uniref:putative leucine-rich repeat receptor-like serine/threonine-protein kinase At2g24130 n=1 Tax=Telopea speciosissima TaxID=54955 RepID=UPI001CC7E7D8|nr:putative leucine-rich repeat receptor-like serine/threonine-protein kinase At2g24130 [Telopea speciosissima]